MGRRNNQQEFVHDRILHFISFFWRQKLIFLMLIIKEVDLQNSIWVDNLVTFRALIEYIQSPHVNLLLLSEKRLKYIKNNKNYGKKFYI